MKKTRVMAALTAPHRPNATEADDGGNILLRRRVRNTHVTDTRTYCQRSGGRRLASQNNFN